MLVEMTTDYNETEWVNPWTGATIPPPNNQESFEVNLEFQLEIQEWVQLSGSNSTVQH